MSVSKEPVKGEAPEDAGNPVDLEEKNRGNDLGQPGSTSTTSATSRRSSNLSISTADSPLINSDDNTPDPLKADGVAPSETTASGNPESTLSLSSDLDSSSPNSGHDEEMLFLLSRLESANQRLEDDSRTLTFEGLRQRFEATRLAARSRSSSLGYGQAQAQKAQSTSGFVGPLMQILSSTISPAAPRVKETDDDPYVNIDWEFWGKVVHNYDNLAQNNPRLLTRHIKDGIPAPVRGVVWQLISKSKDPELEATFRSLLRRSSPFEKIIQRDLSRTFPSHEYFQPDGPGQKSLFHVLKAYSLYDPDVGYCQGVSFVVGALLLNMPEEEAFCVMVRLMKNYEMRGLYTSTMEALQMRLYQFDKLLDEQYPVIAKHLAQEGIKSSMYTSQWFLTLFAYRFPLEIVFRILDVIFCEGFIAVFRFSLALLKKNQAVVLSLDFEVLIQYLKNELFDAYAHDVTQLIEDAYSVKISKKRLDKLAKEWEQESKKFTSEYLELESLRAENISLHEQLKRWKESNEQILEENRRVNNTNNSVTRQRDNYKDLIPQLENQINDFQAIFNDNRRDAEVAVATDMKLLVDKNLSLTRRVADLEERAEDLESRLVETKLMVAELEEEKMESKRKWDRLRKTLE